MKASASPSEINHPCGNVADSAPPRESPAVPLPHDGTRAASPSDSAARPHRPPAAARPEEGRESGRFEGPPLRLPDFRPARVQPLSASTLPRSAQCRELRERFLDRRIQCSLQPGHNPLRTRLRAWRRVTIARVLAPVLTDFRSRHRHRFAGSAVKDGPLRTENLELATGESAAPRVPAPRTISKQNRLSLIVQSVP